MIFLVSLLSSLLFFPAVNSSGDGSRELREQRLKRSVNYREGKFRNQVETPTMAENASFWKIVKARFTNTNNRTPEHTLPTIKRNLSEPLPSGKINITWFGHSSIFLQLAGLNFLIDPVFSKRASPLQFIGPKAFKGTRIVSSNDFPEIDYLLISHNHYDHLDKKTLKEIAPKVKQFYVPLGVGAHLEKWGVPANKIYELDWWDEVQLGSNLLLAATPARHFSGRGLTDRDETLWASFVLKSPSQSVFLSGDSGYGPHFKQIGEKYGPFDITLLECGQYNEYWPNIHMMPEQTAQAFLDLKGEFLIPIHWGKFNLALHPWTEPAERLLSQAAELNIQVVTPKIGELVVVPGKLPQEKWWLRK